MEGLNPSFCAADSITLFLTHISQHPAMIRIPINVKTLPIKFLPTT